MKTFRAIILFTALLGISGLVAAAPFEENFYEINELGGYHFGYNDGRSARQEERTPDGVVRGAYSYVDANGQIQTLTYTSDDYNGFLVSGPHLQPKIGKIPEVGDIGDIIEKAPSAVVQDTPDVAAAKAKHLETVRRVQLGGVPVEYTPEVAAARAAHLKHHASEVLRSNNYVPLDYVR